MGGYDLGTSSGITGTSHFGETQATFTKATPSYLTGASGVPVSFDESFSFCGYIRHLNEGAGDVFSIHSSAGVQLVRLHLETSAERMYMSVGGAIASYVPPDGTTPVLFYAWYDVELENFGYLFFDTSGAPAPAGLRTAALDGTQPDIGVAELTFGTNPDLSTNPVSMVLANWSFYSRKLTYSELLWMGNAGTPRTYTEISDYKGY